MSDPAFSDLVEKRYFQFFRQRTVSATNSIVDSRFWDRVVLQACHTEPAVKHAVLALSSLHQLSGLQIDRDTSRQHRIYAEKQHQMALVEARALIDSASPQDIDRVLVACIIFIIFENVRGDYKAAALHMNSGRAILAQHSERLRQTSRRKDLVEIEHALARVDLPAICFHDRSSPYDYTLAYFYETNPVLTPGPFQDINEAQSTFWDLMRWLLIADNHVIQEEREGNLERLEPYQEEIRKCGDAFIKWHDHFDEAVSRSEPSAYRMILTLRMWYTMATLWMKAESYGPETRFDPFTEVFEQVVEYGEELAVSLADPKLVRSFSYDMGYMIPLFVVGTRCRDPKLRRRSNRLLHDYPRQEGRWESVAAAAICSRWIAVEEEGLGDVTCAADIPEHRRISDIDTEIRIDQKAASMKIMTGDRALEVCVGWREDSPDTNLSTTEPQSDAL